ncbi:prephenate dehydrogenase/arogenate dehydrogenase family protein [Halopenitus persicus]|uniref:Prephenate dehydrogenase n=1 Tax=Halopenitus persicus TaxID=1048396 RepID=A0A1H3K2M5_9EURY|nr:prephenate dehydrogenase/arogenate dehydrogenase family protein [Halopenitus persicus]SDY46447.1 prephenate dehydrogenase [Halopenitus persicus]
MELLVVGAGEMGRWIADTVSSADAIADPAVSFTDLDADRARDAAVGREARALEASTATANRFEVVCLAVPISAVADAVAAYADVADAAMIDVSGAMEAPIAAMRDHLDSDVERASLHPLFAPPRVPGNVAAVVDRDGPRVTAVIEAIEAGGNDVFETTAAEHDEAMETVQAGAHAAILAWRLAGADVREEFHTPVSAGLDDLADTVTEGAPEVYAEIQGAFDGAEDVADAAAAIAEADPEAFAALYERARGEGTERERHE